MILRFIDEEVERFTDEAPTVFLLRYITLVLPADVFEAVYRYACLISLIYVIIFFFISFSVNVLLI